MIWLVQETLKKIAPDFRDILLELPKGGKGTEAVTRILKKLDTIEMLCVNHIKKVFDE